MKNTDSVVLIRQPLIIDDETSKIVRDNIKKQYVKIEYALKFKKHAIVVALSLSEAGYLPCLVESTNYTPNVRTIFHDEVPLQVSLGACKLINAILEIIPVE